ncbi:hypothetical protein BI317_12155 [Xanthomonas hortorum pv. gardneri]|nr:hypothetical protein BJD10_14140 [Xanthomonas hortorum pv. gardneri]APP84805.1 hypothetical protein BI317_12155 [Xanthomonas hortorum pv. gardneri]EGD18889.1 hypothetical protein XGA_2477 [Xanthomonas hortorum ATCC 19865]
MDEIQFCELFLHVCRLNPMVFLALDELLPAAKRYAKGHETVYRLVAGMGTLAISLVLFRFATP